MNIPMYSLLISRFSTCVNMTSLTFTRENLETRLVSVDVSYEISPKYSYIASTACYEL